MKKNNAKDAFPNCLPKTKRQLAQEYGLHPETIRKYCRAIGIRTRGLLFPKDVRKFYDHYGEPNGP